MHVNPSHILRMVPAGFVQDFCPICRAFQSFRIFNLQGGMKIHSWIHGVPRRAGDQILACQNCGFYRTHEGSAPFSEAPAQLPAESAAGMHNTVATRCVSRVDLEARMAQRKLTSAQRMGLIEEPFLLVQAMG